MDEINKLSYEQHKPFKCKKCSNSFPTKHLLKLHENVIHSKGKFECRRCDFRCDIIGMMTFHMRKHIQDERHSKPPDENQTETPDEHEIRAKVPSIVIKLGNNKFNIKSQESQLKFSNNDHDSELKDRKHRVNMSVSKSNGIFFCEICKKRFTQRLSFNKHMIIKHTEVISTQIGSKLDDENIKCLICHKLFSSKVSTKRHMLIHMGEMPFECRKCNSKFNTNISLQQHMVKYHDEIMFKCKKCDERFIQNILLKRHMTAHTGKKPFSCTKCDASFRMRRNLKRHMILGHIKQKPFQCKKQGNKLILKRNVSKTIKKNHTTININITVNSERSLKCMKCKESVKYSQIRSHMDMHQNAFRCESCSRIFNSQHSLKIHRAKAHRENSISTNLEQECESSLSKENMGNSKQSLRSQRAKSHGENDVNINLEQELESSLSKENIGNSKQSL
ncbi:unnamed protein product, partial [Meganyctiphanes norvegica]